MDLLRQANMTAATYYGAAFEETSDPNRAIELAKIAERDFATSAMLIAAQNIADALSEVASAIRYRAEVE